jgi:hypothetical protein
VTLPTPIILSLIWRLDYRLACLSVSLYAGQNHGVSNIFLGALLADISPPHLAPEVSLDVVSKSTCILVPSILQEAGDLVFLP